VRVEQIMTDEAKNYVRSQLFQDTLASFQINHKRTGPYRPQINGKVERFHLTLLREWAYKRPYTSNRSRVRTYQRWIDNYNQQRPHSALDGQSPMTALVNKVHGNDI
jgi:transposase InsO family protein